MIPFLLSFQTFRNCFSNILVFDNILSFEIAFWDCLLFLIRHFHYNFSFSSWNYQDYEILRGRRRKVLISITYATFTHCQYLLLQWSLQSFSYMINILIGIFYLLKFSFPQTVHCNIKQYHLNLKFQTQKSIVFPNRKKKQQ